MSTHKNSSANQGKNPLPKSLKSLYQEKKEPKRKMEEKEGERNLTPT